MRIRSRLQPLGRAVYRLRSRLDETAVGKAASIYTSGALGIVDSLRLARLLNESELKTGLVAIHPRALRGAEVVLRRGSSDPHVAMQTLVYGLHVPPDALEAPRVVWDLGSNIGLTVAHYACLYPQARVMGVEADPENAALARRNIQPWCDRCTIIECAVWGEDGEVAFEVRAGEELAGRIVESVGRSVRARSLTTLLGEESSVDLLKVDIEGAERAVFQRNTDWAAKVRRIIVEVHEPYTVTDCMQDLRRLGFGVAVNPRFRVSVVGSKNA